MTDQQKKSIQDALRMISVIAVSGDAVEVMAAAKENLRSVLREEGQEAAQDG